MSEVSKERSIGEQNDQDERDQSDPKSFSFANDNRDEDGDGEYFGSTFSASDFLLDSKLNMALDHLEKVTNEIQDIRRKRSKPLLRRSNGDLSTTEQVQELTLALKESMEKFIRLEFELQKLRLQFEENEKKDQIRPSEMEENDTVSKEELRNQSSKSPKSNEENEQIKSELQIQKEENMKLHLDIDYFREMLQNSEDEASAWKNAVREAEERTESLKQENHELKLQVDQHKLKEKVKLENVECKWKSEIMSLIRSIDASESLSEPEQIQQIRVALSYLLQYDLAAVDPVDTVSSNHPKKRQRVAERTVQNDPKQIMNKQSDYLKQDARSDSDDYSDSDSSESEDSANDNVVNVQALLREKMKAKHYHQKYKQARANPPNKLKVNNSEDNKSQGIQLLHKRLPADWRLPNGTLPELWRHWWLGEPERNVPPLRILTRQDVKFLDAIPLPEEVRARRSSGTRREPASTTLKAMSHLIRFVTKKVEEADAFEEEINVASVDRMLYGALPLLSELINLKKLHKTKWGSYFRQLYPQLKEWNQMEKLGIAATAPSNECFSL